MLPAPTTSTVHIHSGDSAAQTAATVIAGRHLSYSDLLMVGPIPPLDPSPRQENFLAKRAEVLHEELSVEGYSLAGIQRKLTGELQAIIEALPTADAVFLWYDHCLFDQLLLHFMLSAPLRHYHSPVYLVPCPPDALGFGELPAADLADCLQLATLLPPEAHAESVTTIWPAFTSDQLADIVRLSQSTFAAFPDTPSAAQRLLDELPTPHTGLSQLEAAILSAVLDGKSQFIPLFKAVSATERYPFYGDTYIRKRLDVLAGGPSPLLRLNSNGSITATLQGMRTLWGWGNWRTLNPYRRYVANLPADVPQ